MMTSTSLYYPTQYSQVSSFNEVTQNPSIEWTIFQQDNNIAVSSKRLYTISGMWAEKFRTVTSELWCTGFNIPVVNGTLRGIQVQVDLQRASRIEDNVIQLTFDGDLIGDNLASTVNPVQSSMYTGDFTTPENPAGDNSIYGSSTNLWNTTLTSNNVADSSFGVVLSFKSNEVYPHNDLVYINRIGICLTYT